MIVQTKKRWELSQYQKAEYIEKFTSKLAALRIQANISQEDIANIIGKSRQTYHAIESKKAAMPWNTYLSLIFFFDAIEDTSQMIRELDIYPTQLIEQFNNVANLGSEKSTKLDDTKNKLV